MNREDAGRAVRKKRHITEPSEVLDSPRAGGTIIRGSVLRVGSYAVGVGLSVLAAALMIRHLGPADWGGYVTVASLMTLVAGLSEFGLGNIGVREYSTLGREARMHLIRNLMGLRLALTVLGLLVALTFGLLAGYSTTLLIGTALWGVGLMILFIQQAVGVPLVSRLQLGWVGAFDVLRQTATVVLVVALVALGAGLLPFLAAPIPVGIFMLALTIPLARGMVPLIPGFDRGEWSRLLRMTVAYSVATAVSSIYVSLTVVVMSVLSTSQETGYYGASFRIFLVLGYVPILLASSAFPVLSRAAQRDRSRLRYAVQRMLDVGLILGVLFGLVTGFAADFLIDVVAGPKFKPSIPVLEIHAVALVGTFIAATLAFILLSERRHNAVLVANVLALLLGGALAVGLVPGLGAKGAAWATVGGESALAAVYAIALFAWRSELQISLRVVPKVATAAGLAGTLAFVPELNGAILAAAAAVIYLGVLALLRGIPSELWKAFAFRSALPPNGG